MAKEYISFYRGPEAAYKELRSNNRITENDLYFATDTHVIILNGNKYGGAISSDIEMLVTQVAIDTDGNLEVKYSDGTKKEFPVVNYNSSYADGMEVPNTIGGITAGTKVEDLKSKSISEVLDALLFPTVRPTVQTNPSVIFDFSDGAHKGKTSAIVELGTPVLQVSQASLNKGKWTTGDDYAGDIQNYKYVFTINGTKEVNSEAQSATVPTITSTIYNKIGKNTYTATIGYSNSTTKDNKGNTIQGQGGEKSKTLTVDTGLYWYASTDANKEVISKQTLESATSTVVKEVTLQAHSEAYKQCIKVPVKSGITPTIEAYDPASGSYKKETWKEDTIVEQVNNINVNYYVYTYNDTVRAATKIRVTF